MSDNPHSHIAYVKGHVGKRGQTAERQRQGEHLHSELLPGYLHDYIVPSSSVTALSVWPKPAQSTHGASSTLQASTQCEGMACFTQVLGVTRETCHPTGMVQQG